VSVRGVHLPEEEALWRRDVERRLAALERVNQQPRVTYDPRQILAAQTLTVQGTSSVAFSKLDSSEGYETTLSVEADVPGEWEEYVALWVWSGVFYALANGEQFFYRAVLAGQDQHVKQLTSFWPGSQAVNMPITYAATATLTATGTQTFSQQIDWAGWPIGDAYVGAQSAVLQLTRTA